MKEIKNLEYDLCEEIDVISQNVHQCENPYVRHLKVGKANIISYSDCGHTWDYILDKDESVDLQEFARDCANEADDPELEMIAWGLLSTKDLEVSHDYSGKCRIIIEECFSGYTPLETEEGFDSVKEAQSWIDKKYNKTYYCRHNEQNRPNYTIIPA